MRDLRAGYQRKRLMRRGVPFRTDVFEVGDQLIWGATARILVGPARAPRRDRLELDDVDARRAQLGDARARRRPARTSTARVASRCTTVSKPAPARAERRVLDAVVERQPPTWTRSTPRSRRRVLEAGALELVEARASAGVAGVDDAVDALALELRVQLGARRALHAVLGPRLRPARRTSGGRPGASPAWPRRRRASSAMRLSGTITASPSSTASAPPGAEVVLHVDDDQRLAEPRFESRTRPTGSASRHRRARTRRELTESAALHVATGDLPLDVLLDRHGRRGSPTPSRSRRSS